MPDLLTDKAIDELSVYRDGIVAGSHESVKKELAKRFRSNMTRAEKKLWDCIRAGKLNGLHFRRQQIIDGLIADFYCHGAALVIEVDGEVHEAQRAYDSERSRILECRGLFVLRFTNERVLNDTQNVLVEIEAIAVERRERIRSSD